MKLMSMAGQCFNGDVELVVIRHARRAKEPKGPRGEKPDMLDPEAAPKQLAAVRRVLADLSFKPNILGCSALNRTWQTATGVFPGLEQPIPFQAAGYDWVDNATGLAPTAPDPYLVAAGGKPFEDYTVADFMPRIPYSDMLGIAMQTVVQLLCMEALCRKLVELGPIPAYTIVQAKAFQAAHAGNAEMLLPEEVRSQTRMLGEACFFRFLMRIRAGAFDLQYIERVNPLERLGITI